MSRSCINILVTGGAGYIGSHVCHLLIDQGYNVTCIDSLITGNKKLLPKEVNLEVFDISEEEKVTRLIQSNKFDIVIHFAGLIRVDESVQEPEKYREFNFIKAKKFLETWKSDNLPNPFDVTKQFIQEKGLKIYGGLALHELLSKKKSPIYDKYEFPKIKYKIIPVKNCKNTTIFCTSCP